MHTGHFRYKRLGPSGASPYCQTMVRVLEFEQVIDASSRKGTHAPFEVVDDPRRYVPPPTNGEVEWTLLWTRHTHGGSGEHQLLSMIHHNAWRRMFEKFNKYSNYAIARAVHQGTVDDMGGSTPGFTSKRCGGSGGLLDFQQVDKIVSVEVGRTEPWFVQISPTSAYAMYISPFDLKGAATMCGNAIRGGEANPTLTSRDNGNEVYAHFLDEFSRGRINAARLVAAVNKTMNLSIACDSIEMVEEQWRQSIVEVMVIDEVNNGVPWTE